MGLPGRGDEPLTGTADLFLSAVRGEKGSIPLADKTKAHIYIHIITYMCVEM